MLQQYLFIMNSPFFQKRAGALAKRFVIEGETNEARIDRAYQLLFNRPHPMTRHRPGLHPGQHRGWLNQYAQALLGSEEFRYIE